MKEKTLKKRGKMRENWRWQKSNLHPKNIKNKQRKYYKYSVIKW